jgi:nucleotide-binding universal stress UspA family protein
MTYRSVLVHLDLDRRADARIAYALRLSREFDCHLVGAAPTGVVPLAREVSIEAASSLAEYAQAAWAALRNHAQAACASFDSACRNAGLRSHETISEHADRVKSLVRLAHCSDLVVLSHADPGETSFPQARDLVADVVLGSARPTVVLPHAGQFGAIPSRAIVAWDDSREAARAVADALPLLRLAHRVQIVTWVDSTDADRTSWQERQRAVQQWLTRQGVSAELHLQRREIGLAEAMLSHAADFDADLIVMGAYGHSRWAERVLGGATRGMLDAMTIPVLLSH